MRDAGFEIIENFDLSVTGDIPWYQPLTPRLTPKGIFHTWCVIFACLFPFPFLSQFSPSLSPPPHLSFTSFFSLSVYLPFSSFVFFFEFTLVYRLGRWVALKGLGVLESIRLAPAGSASTLDMLQRGANCLCDAGSMQIFSPMWWVLARKPE